jgi:hypothetical protein
MRSSIPFVSRFDRLSRESDRLLGRVLINRDRSHSPIDVRFAPTSGGKADVPGGPSRAMKRREQVQRNCQCASTSRQKTHQAKADRAPRFRQCLIIAPRSSTCRVELHWRLGPGADHGRMARIAEAWDRSTAPGATSRSTISSASVRLQRLRLACRSGAQLIPILATRYGWARPGHACLWTDILNPL